MSKQKWLTLDEASKRSGIPRYTLKRWLYRKTNPLASRLVLRDGRMTREVAQDVLDAYERPQMGGVR